MQETTRFRTCPMCHGTKTMKTLHLDFIKGRQRETVGECTVCRGTGKVEFLPLGIGDLGLPVAVGGDSQ